MLQRFGLDQGTACLAAPGTVEPGQEETGQLQGVPTPSPSHHLQEPAVAAWLPTSWGAATSLQPGAANVAKYVKE